MPGRRNNVELLKQRILNEGRVLGNNVLKVDSFLNHQIDVGLFNEIGREFKKIFQNDKVDKILTIESSGIGLACITAQYFNVPVVFAKKSMSSNLDRETYQSQVASFTRNAIYKIHVSQNYIKPEENILIIDDFLANGQAVLGLVNIVEQAKANLVGAGIVIEKCFQGGRKLLVEKGIRVESLAIIESMNNGKLVFK
jgi:xanthine phosphoribosyltransferase